MANIVNSGAGANISAEVTVTQGNNNTTVIDAAYKAARDFVDKPWADPAPQSWADASAELVQNPHRRWLVITGRGQSAIWSGEKQLLQQGQQCEGACEFEAAMEAVAQAEIVYGEGHGACVMTAEEFDSIDELIQIETTQRRDAQKIWEF